MRTDFQNVLIEQDESVIRLTMNRPDVLNAINTLMLEELTEPRSILRDNYKKPPTLQQITEKV